MVPNPSPAAGPSAQPYSEQRSTVVSKVCAENSEPRSRAVSKVCAENSEPRSTVLSKVSRSPQPSPSAAVMRSSSSGDAASSQNHSPSPRTSSPSPLQAAVMRSLQPAYDLIAVLEEAEADPDTVMRPLQAAYDLADLEAAERGLDHIARRCGEKRHFAEVMGVVPAPAAAKARLRPRPPSMRTRMWTPQWGRQVSFAEPEPVAEPIAEASEPVANASVEPVAEPIAEAAEPVAEVSVPWEIAPSTWMFPSRVGVLNAFLDSLPATGTVAVDRMPESSAETAEETAEETVVSADDPDWGSTSPPPSPPPRPPPEPASPLFGKSRRIAETTFAEVTETSAEPVEPVADTYAEPDAATRPPPDEASASADELS